MHMFISMASPGQVVERLIRGRSRLCLGEELHLKQAKQMVRPRLTWLDRLLGIVGGIV